MGKFFKTPWSHSFDSNNNYNNICQVCLKEMFDQDSRVYKDKKTALLLFCHRMDIPFYHEAADKELVKDDFILGNYVKYIVNVTQYKHKTFIDSLLDGELVKADEEVRDQKEIKWKASDIKNKNYVIHIIGYDCFEDINFTDSDRRYLFNTLTDYLSDDVIEEPHKLQ